MRSDTGARNSEKTIAIDMKIKMVENESEAIMSKKKDAKLGYEAKCS